MCFLIPSDLVRLHLLHTSMHSTRRSLSLSVFAPPPSPSSLSFIPGGHTGEPAVRLRAQHAATCTGPHYLWLLRAELLPERAVALRPERADRAADRAVEPPVTSSRSWLISISAFWRLRFSASSEASRRSMRPSATSVRLLQFEPMERKVDSSLAPLRAVLRPV